MDDKDMPETIWVSTEADEKMNTDECYNGYGCSLSKKDGWNDYVGHITERYEASFNELSIHAADLSKEAMIAAAPTYKGARDEGLLQRI